MAIYNAKKLTMVGPNGDTYIIDPLQGKESVYIDLTVTIQSNQWSATEPYTYVYTDSHITANSAVYVYFKDGVRDGLVGDLKWTKATGSVTFVTTEPVVGDIPLVIRVIDSTANATYPIDASMIETDAVIGETNVQGALEYLSSKTTTDIANAVTDWLDDNIPTGQTVVVDQSLTINGAAADAKKTGDELSDLKSAVTQNTRNLFDLYALPEKTGISVSDNVITGTATAFNTAFGANTVGIMSGTTFKENTQYTITFDAKNSGEGSGNGLAFIVSYTDNTVNYIVCNVNETAYTHHKGITTSGKTVSKIGIGYFANPANTWDVKNIQVEEGTSETDYIPFLSATDYIARESIFQNSTNIRNIEVEITQNATLIKNQLKNYNAFNAIKFNISETKDNVTVVGTDDEITVNGTASSASTYFDVVSTTNITDTELVPDEYYWFDTGLRNLGVDGKFVIYFNTGSGFAKSYDNLYGVCNIYIPKNCTGVIIRYYPSQNETYVNRHFSLSFTKNKPGYMLNRFADFRFLRAFGTGDSTIIKFGDGTTLVIDFGINEPQGTLQSSWNTAITELGITHIDYAIISHYHPDHIGMLLYGISTLIDQNTIFFLPGGHPYTTEELDALAWVDEMSGDNNVQNYEDVTTILDTIGCRKIYPQENDKWYIGGAEIQFWNADQQYIMNQFIAHTMYDYNNASLCNYITIGDYRICFSGDIGIPVMEHYDKTVLSSQVFKVNHHSVGYDVVPLFLNSLMPKLDVSMLGYNLAVAMLPENPNQQWCEENNVPNVVTGVNEKTLSLRVSNGGYNFTTACRRLICDEEWPTT